MKAICKTFVFLIVLGFYCGCSEHSADNRIKVTVKSFMLETGNLGEFKKKMKILYKDPKLSVKFLITELHTINDVWYDGSSIDAHKDNPDTYHVTWCIRGLRHLTGKNFFAPTKEKITDERRRGHLYLDDETEKVMPFFMTRMSSGGIMYIAPKDAQESIINQWKEWYKKEGQTYDYEKNRIDITDVEKYVR